MRASASGRFRKSWGPVEREHDHTEDRTHAAFAALRRRVVRAANDFAERLVHRVERNALSERTQDPGYGELVRDALLEFTNFLTGLVDEPPAKPRPFKREKRDE